MARAKLVVDSGLAPAGITPQKLAVIMLKGQELGLRPLEAMESLYVVQGKVGEMTHHLVNMLRAAGHDYRINETTMEQCTVTIYRSDGQTYRHTVTFKECADARWNQYWDNTDKVWKVKATWQGGGQRTMLAYRAISQAIRLYCPEVLHQAPGQRVGMVSAPINLADAWYRYTRTLLHSNGLESVLNLVRSLAQSDTVEDSPDMLISTDHSAVDSIEAEFYEQGEDDDLAVAAVAPQSPATPPPGPGKPRRPYPPEIVRQGIRSRVARGSAEPAGGGMRGAALGAVEALFGSAPKESRAHMRHQVTTYLLDKGSSNGWTHGECQALLDWAQERTEDGAYVPNEHAIQEAAAIVLTLDAPGQQELPL
jgi:hypothetical protein